MNQFQCVCSEHFCCDASLPQIKKNTVFDISDVFFIIWLWIKCNKINSCNLLSELPFRTPHPYIQWIIISVPTARFCSDCWPPWFWLVHVLILEWSTSCNFYFILLNVLLINVMQHPLLNYKILVVFVKCI